MVTRWGIQCGMDNYVRELTQAVADDIEFVICASRESGAEDTGSWRILRDWDHTSDDIATLTRDLEEMRPDVLHIQFNWGYITLGALGRLLSFASARRIPCIVQVHASVRPEYARTAGSDLAPLASALRGAAVVIVHGQHEVEGLNALGVTDNLWLWGLGEKSWRAARRCRLTSASRNRRPAAHRRDVRVPPVAKGSA